MNEQASAPLPAWTTAAQTSPSAGAAKSGLTWALSGCALLCLAVPALRPGALAQNAILTLAAVALGVAALGLRGHMRRAEENAEKFERIFERAGISMWLEDWTPVGESLRALMRNGISDMQQYFTEHPDEARKLRRAVIIKDVNAFTVEMMGAPDKSVFLGPLDRLLPDTDHTFIEWLIAFGKGDRFYRSETHIVRPDNSHLECLFTAPLPDNLEGFKNILVSCFDITDYKHSQERLIQAESEIARVSRVTTIGALTASIAHELNSPLASIVSNAEAALRWLRRPLPEMREAEDALNRVVADSIRVSEVVARTRSFLSNSPKRTHPLDMAEIVRQSIVLIERELRSYNISLHFDADDGLPPVLADAIQIQQVMVNLMINGAQAMATIAGPRDLTVTVRRCGQDVRVDVRDIGQGIGPEHLPRVFEPFYTSKSNGMGMGLAICRNCVEAHGGKLWVTSEVNRGTVFSFLLSISPDAA